MAVCQNLVPLVNIKIAGKWMFIPLKMVLIGIDPYPDLQTPGKRGRELRAVGGLLRYGKSLLWWDVRADPTRHTTRR